MVEQATVNRSVAGSSPAPGARPSETILTNARIALPGEIRRGSLLLRAGRIAAIDPGPSRLPAALDCDGDFLIPGAIDLHTDNLERQVQPRGGVRWPSRSALLAHDAQCAAAGITTIFDALCVGDLGFDEDRPRTCTEGAADLAYLAPTGLLRADHYLHLRCELPAIGMIDQLRPLLGHPLLRLISLMDHTPGTGQYANLAQYRAMRLRDGEPPERTDARIAELQAQQARLREANRASLLALVNPAMVASHDDRTEAEIAENHAAGIRIAEFPVTRDAAAAAKRLGHQTIAGAPNVVRGGSHTGNVSAAELIRAGLIDALASDYVPQSLIEAAFLLPDRADLPLPAALRLITDGPARMIGLTDRGRIEPGLRADLVQIRMHETLPVVRKVWAAGNRVA